MVADASTAADLLVEKTSTITRICVECKKVPQKQLSSFQCPKCLYEKRSAAESTFYVCSKDCQRAFWAGHKFCKHTTRQTAASSARSGAAAGGGGSGGSSSSSTSRFGRSIESFNLEDILMVGKDPTAWAQQIINDGFQPGEWFVDCYRMRIDDEYSLGGEDLQGLYDLEKTKTDIVKHFLVFSKMAIRNKVIPQGEGAFSWTRVLIYAQRLLGLALDKGDAQEKYGGENVFNIKGASLRRTGEAVMGFSVMGGTHEGDKPYHEVRLLVEKRIAGPAFFEGARAEEDSSLFDDVGGSQEWFNLWALLQIPGRPD